MGEGERPQAEQLARGKGFDTSMLTILTLSLFLSSDLFCSVLLLRSRNLIGLTNEVLFPYRSKGTEL